MKKVKLVIANNKIIDVCDDLHYLKRSEDEKLWVDSNLEDGEVVTVNGQFYNVPGKEPIEGITEEIKVVEKDIGKLLLTLLQNTNSDHAELLDSKIEVKESQELLAGELNTRMDGVEDALCEMDARITE